ncbi:unnamed protein product [Ilex paraguariensis]|uniref:FAS1 domain-containing protein n=1 Tax=Ilex paraguariensis TaxID=185542 RepID=A0ABC8RZL0_9AQUA
MALTITNLRLISTTESPLPASSPQPTPLSLPPPTNLSPPPEPRSTPTIPTPPPTIPSPPITTSPPPSPTITEPPPLSPPAIMFPSPPPPPPAELQAQQLNNIIDALIGAGDFAGWANILSSTDPSTLPLSSTLFIPGNEALSHLPTDTATGMENFEAFLIPYHIVPQRLSFSDLQLFKTSTRLPTLLPSKTILITNNSLSNFTIDDSIVSHPDIYLNSAMAVHGIGAILDYTVYGGDFFAPPDPIQVPAPPQPVVPPFFPTGEIIGGRRNPLAR